MLALGFFPMLIWLLIAVFYYGTPIPNTALAKLNVDIPRAEMMGQGFVYLLSTLHHDPLTAVVLAVGMLVGFSGTDPARKAAALGILLHLAYVVWVAGDFMLGRFLSVPFVGAICVLAAAAKEFMTDSHKSESRAWAVAALIGVLAFLSPHNPFSLQDGERHLPGLSTSAPGTWPIPVVYAPDWRTAHYGRVLPAGYLDSLLSGDNWIVDVGLHEYNGHVKLVVSGPILSWQRLRTALVLNLGGYDHLLPMSDP